MSGYELHPEAQIDLDEIFDFIAADSVESAERVINEILARAGSLASSPYRGHGRILPARRCDL